MGAGSSSQSALTNAANKMVSTIIVNIALHCNTRAVSDQIINVNCDPGYHQDAIDVWENNDGCRACINNVVESRKSYYARQEALWATETKEVRGSIDQDYQNVIAQFNSCQISHCKACVLANVSQSTVIDAKADCQALNNISNTISQQLVQQVTQSLTNNQDVLSGLAGLLGAKSSSDVISNVSSRISSLITQDVATNIRQTIENNQTLTLSLKDGGSTVLAGATQDSAYNSAMTYLGKTQIMNNIFSEAEWKTLQTLINDQNTIDSLGNSVVKTVGYISNLLTSVVGKVLFFVLIMVGVIFLSIVVYITTNIIKKSLQKSRAKEDVLKSQMSQMPALQTF